MSTTIIWTIAIISVLGMLLACVLWLIAEKFKVVEDPRIDEVEKVMPGANCGGCGFAGCRAFAEAAVKAPDLDNNYCPVGGSDVMAKVAPPKRPQRLPVYFRQQEVERIYDDGFPDTFDGQTERLVLRMLYETGMRRSELASLTVGSVDLGALYIKVRGKRNKERLIPIENELANNISRYLALREQTLAQLQDRQPAAATDRLLINGRGKPISDNRIYHIVEHYMRPLSTADRTSPHVFRHTFATHMLSEGAEIEAIRQLLGHSSLSSTEIYTHVSREYLKETYKHAHPRAHKK